MSNKNLQIYTKEDFLLVLSLLNKFEWLNTEERQEALLELLELCQTQKEKDIISHTIQELTFVQSSEVDQLMLAILETVLRTWSLNAAQIQFVACTVDGEADSAQSMLWILKKHLRGVEKSKVETTNFLGRAVKKAAKYPYIVLIDEFSGTGNTLANRAKTLRSNILNHFSTQGIAVDFRIYACTLACMNHAVPTIGKEVSNFFSPLLLSRGIKDHFAGLDFLNAAENMLSIERCLERTVGDTELPSFGYGKAEALYGTEFGNTPNSVFPILWWPYLKHMRQRKTLLARGERSL